MISALSHIATGRLKKMKFSTINLLLIALVLMHTNLLNAQPSVVKNDTSRIGIAVTTKPLMQLVIPAFSAKNAALHFNTIIDQTAVVVDSVISGFASVAITTRTIKDYEKQKAPILVGTPIGLDGLVLAVERSNPITNLTFNQIVGIYTGVITNWKELGGNDLPIVVIGRNKAYDPINLFADFMQLDVKLVDKSVLYSAKGKDAWSKIPAPALATNDEALAKLNNINGAITYFPLQVLNEYKVKGLNVKSVAFNGIEATHQTIENGTYFIHRQLNAITNGKPNKSVQVLIDFLLNKEGQQLINKAGFLSLSNNNQTSQPIQKIKVDGGLFQQAESSVKINSFQISKYEITNQQYAIFLNRKEVKPNGIFKEKQLINVGNKDLQVEFVNNKWQVKSGRENHPMVMVSYYGAMEYCKWIGAKLPAELQWKYAASGGNLSKHFKYAGSNILDEVGWYKNNSNQQSHAVGEKQPNELGIYDMSGNAWEWCLNDSLKSDTSLCVHMGGSWYASEQPSSINAHYGNTPTHFSNSVGFRVVFPIEQIVNLTNYKGKPWNTQPQQIPGKIQCEWYDKGGEGIAFHDADSVNSGSGRLNPANGTFLNEFRISEAVDISYTKSRDIDNSPYNVVEPEMDQLYTGWTEPGEWINYSIDVTETANYSIGIMYTASGDGSIELLLDGKELTGELLIPSTRNDKETIAWRNWHHWNRIDDLTTVQLKKGKHLLTLKTITNGNMNYDYLSFSVKK